MIVVGVLVLRVEYALLLNPKFDPLVSTLAKKVPVCFSGCSTINLKVIAVASWI